MKVIYVVKKMQDVSLRCKREGKRIGFVPTMGFLHEGHVSLIRKARRTSDVVVVSIFVNPVQFGPGEDLDKYPRDFERDRKVCEEAGTDIIFCPSAGEMYASDQSVFVEETRLSRGLCGKSRPGHFRGVATVVAKLFNIVQPDVAVFGQKDAQQARIIQRVVRDLNFPVEIVVAPVVREPGGIAMSSRNTYLSPLEYEQAACIHRALCLAEHLSKEGATKASIIRREMVDVIRKTSGIKIEYVQIVSNDTLEPVNTIDGPTLVAVAVKIGRTRLIDNTVIKPRKAYA